MKKLAVFFLIILSVNIAPATDFGKVETKKELKSYLDNAYSVKEIRGNFSLPEKEVVQSNLLLMDGKSEIDGIVEGNLVALNCDILIAENAELFGDLVLVNSDYRKEGGKVYGKIVRNRDADLLTHTRHKSLGFATWRFNDETGESELQFGSMRQSLFLEHNRSQGFFMGLKWPNLLGSRVRWVNINVNLGYGFSDKKFRYSVGFKRAFSSSSPFFLGFGFYDIIDSYDKWKITTFENTISSFTYKEDFFDYFRRQGGNLSLSYETVPLKLTIGYRLEKQQTAYINTDWSLFVKDRKYRENPAADEGRFGIIYFNGFYSTAVNPLQPRTGISLRVAGESAFSKIKSDYAYNFASATLKAYLPLSKIDVLNVRLYAGSLEGLRAPAQRYFRTGGIGTIRAFPLNDQKGNRSLLATVEYRLNFFDIRNYYGGDKPWSGGIGLFSDFGSTLNVDGELNWYDGFENFTVNKIKNSVGVSFFLGADFLRIDVAKRTDRGDHDFYTYLRLKTTL